MHTSIQRKIHYLSLGVLFLGGLGLMEGKWYETTIGLSLCTASIIFLGMLLPSLIKRNKTSKWNKTVFFLEFILLLLLALVHLLPAHYPLSVVLTLVALCPAIAWVRVR